MVFGVRFAQQLGSILNLGRGGQLADTCSRFTGGEALAECRGLLSVSKRKLELSSQEELQIDFFFSPSIWKKKIILDLIPNSEATLKVLY